MATAARSAAVAPHLSMARWTVESCFSHSTIGSSSTQPGRGYSQLTLSPASARMSPVPSTTMDRQLLDPSSRASSSGPLTGMPRLGTGLPAPKLSERGPDGSGTANLSSHWWYSAICAAAPASSHPRWAASTAAISSIDSSAWPGSNASSTRRASTSVSDRARSLSTAKINSAASTPAGWTTLAQLLVAARSTATPGTRGCRRDPPVA